MLVYLITNKIDGKRYVGQTIRTAEERWSEHRKLSAKPSRVSPYLHNAVRKHGAENFKVETLVIVGTKQEMDYYERALIEKLNTRSPSGYNLTDGGDGVLGHKHSEESKEKNRRAHLGIRQSDETKEKKRLASLGLRHSEETKQKMSRHIKSEEHRRKISEAKMGNKSRTGMKASAEEIKKKSDSLMGRKLSAAHINSLKIGSHNRHHVNRGIKKSGCKLCNEGISNGSRQQNLDSPGPA